MTRRRVQRRRQTAAEWEWSNPARVAEPWLREEAREKERRYREYMAALCAAVPVVVKEQQLALWPEAA